jgi:hypothetical protein
MSGRSHENLSGHIETKVASERSFGITFGVVFAIVAVIMFFHHHWYWKIPAGLSALSFALGQFAPSTLTTPNRWWFKFGLLLHKIISPLVLGVLFFLMVTPISILARLTGFDPMRKKFQPEVDSYWLPVDTERSDKWMERQF